MIQGNTSWPKRKAVETVKPSNNKRRAFVISSFVAVFLLGSVGLAYALGFFTDSRITEIRALQAKLQDDSLSQTDRQALWQELRSKMGALPDNLRAELRGNRGRGGDPSQMFQREKVILAMPHDQMIAEVDKEIDRDVAREAERAKRRAAEDAKKPAGDAGKTKDGGGPTGGGPPGAGGDAAAGQGGPGGPPSGRPARSEADRVAARHQFLSRIPPEDRVAHSQYRELVKARAAQRGVSVPQRGS